MKYNDKQFGTKTQDETFSDRVTGSETESKLNFSIAMVVCGSLALLKNKLFTE
jgi:hypothetical protein